MSTITLVHLAFAICWNSLTIVWVVLVIVGSRDRSNYRNRKINARRREQETLERKQEVAELEKIIPTVCCECGGSGKLDYGFGETSCPICNSLDTTETQE